MSKSFALQRATESRLLRRSCESLLGICAGLLADGKLTDQEIFFLDQWLIENADLANTWPGDMVASRVRAALADKTVSNEEKEHLQQTLQDLMGGTLEETGAIGGLSVRLPFDQVEDLTIPDNRFCLTGNFLYGTRSKCTSAIVDRGGEVLSNIRKDLNYLVVGTLVTKEWKNSSFGNKIQKAIDYREKGVPVRIVSEQFWARHLPLYEVRDS